MRRILLYFLLFAVSLTGQAEQFVYKHSQGNKYRVLSTVNEDVYIDRRLHHRSEIVNRIAVEIIKTDNNIGSHKAVFQTGEKAVRVGTKQGGFQWDKDYESVFDRDELGYVTIDSRYFMPVVRNVPVFPDKDIKVGDTWSGEGYEMHDFRESFGIAEPYCIPFTANYKFLGNKEWKGKVYPAFSVSYRIFTEPDFVSGLACPTRIMGASDQVVYWDVDIGQAASYNEHFRMVFELSNGLTIEYRGTAEAEIVEAETMNKKSIIDEITENIEKLDIKDATVKIVDDGIMISLENIQFLPESAVLLDSEKAKLDKLGEILMRYKDRDLLVSGHTAYSGTQESMMQLSRDRASTVADYLIDKNVRTPDRVVIRGYGGGRPIADNSTEKGRIKNRRVEITILEN